MRSISRRHFGVFSALRSTTESIKHVSRLLFAPSDMNRETVAHTNFRFDEESAEWQSLVTRNSYEEMIFLNQDMPPLMNFGTVDNPHLVFTSEVPFRFVACTGPPSEDDFEYHEIMWMLLREGPMQRCSGCGQVFKLIRLRDEFSAENDYYTTGMTEQIVEELGEADVFGTFSLFRPFMFFTGEHTYFETTSNYAYSMMRMDDHDRYLTDPAFRLEHNQMLEEKYKTLVDTLTNIDLSFKENFGVTPMSHLSKDQYENIIETEKSIEMLDRHFERVHKFDIREFLDPANHERRQERMEKRMFTRQNNPTFYFGETDEALAQYEDYFETDCEVNPVNPRQDLKDAEKRALQREDNDLNMFDFRESYTQAHEREAQGLIEREIFRYKYREAADDLEEFESREANRLAKREEWLASGRLDEAVARFRELEKIASNPAASAVERNSHIDACKLAYKAIIDLELELCILNHASYYHDDEEIFVGNVNMGTALDQIDSLPNVEKLRLLEISDLELDTLKKGLIMVFPKEAVNGQKNGFIGYLLESFAIAENIDRNTSVLGGKEGYALESPIDYKTYVGELKEKQLIDEGNDYVEKNRKTADLD